MIAGWREEPSEMEWAETNLSTVAPGFRFPVQRIRLDRRTVDTYLAAVEDQSRFTGKSRHRYLHWPSWRWRCVAWRGCWRRVRAPCIFRSDLPLVEQSRRRRRSAKVVVQSRSERRGFAALNLAVTVVWPASPVARQAGDEQEIALEAAMLLSCR